MNSGGKLVKSAAEKARVLNEQFKLAFSSGVQLSFEEFEQQSEMDTSGSSYAKLKDIDIKEQGVAKLLQSINLHKASGPDNIHLQVLKELAQELAPILTYIFRRSLALGEVPSD
ncbi:MAG: hypothetical protein M3H12_04105 [Chromatiales bacterium]